LKIAIRGLAGIVGMATLMVFVVACSGSNEAPPAVNLSGTSAATPAPLNYEQWCRKWTPGADCSPSLFLTDQDRSELIRQTLERAPIGNEMIAAEVSVKDNESVVLSTENINASLVPDIPNRDLILLRPEEIQKKADDQGDFMFLSFDRIEPRGSVISVVLANTLAKGKDSEKTEGYMSGGFFTIEYQSVSGEWVSISQGVAVP
jgi:hypothetical protein